MDEFNGALPNTFCFTLLKNVFFVILKFPPQKTADIVKLYGFLL